MTDDLIAVHWIGLDAADATDAPLSADERARAMRLRSPLLRRRFVAGRAALRGVLAERIGGDAASVRLVAGPHGKPALAGAPLAFNLSHSGGVAVIAVGGVRPLGVDCEAVGHDAAAIRQTLEPLLSRAERALLAGRTEREATLLLHRLWTRKEAVAKVGGLGVGFPFAAMTVLGGAGRPIAVAGHGAFRLRDLAAPPGFVAALAAAGPAPFAVRVVRPA